MAAGAGAIEGAGKSLGSMALKVPMHSIPIPGMAGGSLLTAMRSMNPSALNAHLNSQIAQRQSMRQILAGLNPGNVLASHQIQTTAQTATNHTPAFMTHLDGLVRQLQANAVGSNAHTTALQGISTHVRFNVDATNVKQRLQSMLTQMGTAGAGAATAAGPALGATQGLVNALP